MGSPSEIGSSDEEKNVGAKEGECRCEEHLRLCRPWEGPDGVGVNENTGLSSPACAYLCKSRKHAFRLRPRGLEGDSATWAIHSRCMPHVYSETCAMHLYTEFESMHP